MTDSLEKKITAAEQIGIMLESNAWKEYVGPLLDRMITDVIGGKEDGRWLGCPPKLNERTLEEKEWRFLLGYKAGLIDFHEAVYGIIDEAKAAQEAEAEQDDKETDMLNSPYNDEVI